MDLYKFSNNTYSVKKDFSEINYWNIFEVKNLNKKYIKC